MKKLLVLLTTTATMLTVTPQVGYAQETRDQLLESVLLNRYWNLIYQTVKGPFRCSSVVQVKRLGEPNEFKPKFEVQVRTVTYTGAHNPPYDLFTIDIIDDLRGAKVVHFVRTPNVSASVLKAQCEHEKAKMDLHYHQFR